MSDCTLIKYPEESRNYGFDFANQPEIDTDSETLVSVPSAPSVTATRLTGSGSLTLGTPSISGSNVSFSVEGGDLGDLYALVCEVYTSGGSLIAARGLLQISRPC